MSRNNKDFNKISNHVSKLVYRKACIESFELTRHTELIFFYIKNYQAKAF